MSIVPSFLQGQLWKVGALAAGVLSVVLTGLLIAATFETRDMTKQRNELSRQINDPATGYVARLAQSRTNEAQLADALEVQKKKFQAAAEVNNAKLKETEAALKQAQAQTAAMEARLKGFLATKPRGNTLEERIRDIDARGLKEMVQ